MWVTKGFIFSLLFIGVALFCSFVLFVSVVLAVVLSLHYTVHDMGEMQNTPSDFIWKSMERVQFEILWLLRSIWYSRSNEILTPEDLLPSSCIFLSLCTHSQHVSYKSKLNYMHQNTQEIKRTLFNMTDQDKKCKFSM